jgi:hypothetical protein
MISAFHDFAVIHYDNHIRIANRRKPMCNYDARAVLHNKLHGVLNRLLSTGIYVRGCLIQNQNFGVSNKGACNSKKLPLSLADVCTIKGKFSFQRTLEIKNARWKRA